ncbi:MAG: lysylphosphatidylglycerol synthase transmembrane domain-containing protein [Candidatus Bathyarchaeota archaeon]
MKTKNRSNLKLIISASIGIILLGGMFWYVGFDKLLTAIGKASPLWLLVSSLLLIPTWLLRAWRWKLLLIPVKKSIKISNTFWSTAIGFMINTLIPIRIGEFIRAYILGEKEKIGFPSSISSIVVERTLDMVGLLTLGLILLLILPVGVSIPSWFLNAFVALAVLVVVILVVIVVGTKREGVVLNVISRIIRPISFLSKRREKILNAVKGFFDGMKVVSQSPRLLLKTLTPTYALWILQLFIIWSIFKAFDHPASLLIILLGAVILYFTYIIPAAPGYVGSYEAYWTIIFLALGITQIDLLLAMGLVSHLIGVITMIVLGCIGTVWLGLSFEQVFRLRRPDKV